VYADDFKMAGPTANLEKAWKSIRDAVNIGDPEPYDCYFGCMHREFENIRLPKEAHPFAFAFDAKTSAAAQHRTQDWWEHDESNTAWIRHHVQPRKTITGDEGGESIAVKIQVVLLSLTKTSHPAEKGGALPQKFSQLQLLPDTCTHGFQPSPR